MPALADHPPTPPPDPLSHPTYTPMCCCCCRRATAVPQARVCAACVLSAPLPSEAPWRTAGDGCCCCAARRKLAHCASAAGSTNSSRCDASVANAAAAVGSYRVWLCVCPTGPVPLEPQARPAPQTRATAGRCLRSVLSGRSRRLVQSARQSVCACLATVGVPAPEIPAKCALRGLGPLVAAHRPAFLAALATAGAHMRPGFSLSPMFIIACDVSCAVQHLLRTHVGTRRLLTPLGCV